MRKKILAIILVLILILCISCGKENEKDAMQTWEENAMLNKEETTQELYEKALEENILQIYTVSGRLFDVAEAFQQKYPGLLVEVTYLRAEELTTKIKENVENNTYECDLIFITNGDGSLTEELIPEKLAYKYVPKSIENKLLATGNDAYLSVILEVALLCYNDSYYDTCPISNWWELLDSKWKGKLYITDPTRSMISYTIFSMMEKNDDEMKNAYLEYFGTEYDEKQNGECATHYFIQRLVENELHVLNDSDDVAVAIAEPGTQSANLGILNASKMRLREQGYSLMACYELVPFAGVINPANIMIAGGSENINSAKLFIQFIMGEEDGNGDGYKPFLQEGAWPARIDIETASTQKLDEINAIYTDETYGCNHRDSFLEFWDEIISH